jgi:hypothetical protein
MPAPLVVGAAAAAAKLLAKKVAKDSAKKISKATAIGIKTGRTTGKTKAILRASDKYGKSKITKGKNSKPLAEPKSAVRVKPAAKQKPNKPNPSKMEYKFGMGINRARAKDNDVLLTNPGRKNRIQADKYKKSK